MNDKRKSFLQYQIANLAYFYSIYSNVKKHGLKQNGATCSLHANQLTPLAPFTPPKA